MQELGYTLDKFQFQGHIKMNETNNHSCIKIGTKNLFQLFDREKDAFFDNWPDE